MEKFGVIKKLILLAPFDNIYMAESYTKGKWKEFLKIAKQNVIKGKGEEIIPKHWWDIELSYNSYVSWLDDNDYTHMFDFHDPSYTFPILHTIHIPVKVIVGSKDKFFHTSNPQNPQEAINILKRNIKDFSYYLIDNANHSYTGYENTLVEEVKTILV